MTLNGRVVDLLQREAGIAARLFRPTHTALVACRVGVLNDYLEDAMSTAIAATDRDGAGEQRTVERVPDGRRARS